MIKENLGQTEIIEKNLEDVKNLTLKRYKLNGKINDIDLDELKLFKNIETLMLSNFSIQTKDLENINEKKELDAIQFSSCDFENIIPINSNISYIVLDHCQNVQLELINNNKIVKIIGAKFNLKNLDNFSKIEKLYLQDCAIIKSYINQWRKIHGRFRGEIWKSYNTECCRFTIGKIRRDFERTINI